MKYYAVLSFVTDDGRSSVWTIREDKDEGMLIKKIVAYYVNNICQLDLYNCIENELKISREYYAIAANGRKWTIDIVSNR